MDPDDRRAPGPNRAIPARTSPSRSLSPSRYFCVVAMRHSHHGAPTTSAASKARL